MLNSQSVLRNDVTFVLFSTVSFRFVSSRVCVFLYSLGPWCQGAIPIFWNCSSVKITVLILLKTNFMLTAICHVFSRNLVIKNDKICQICLTVGDYSAPPCRTLAWSATHAVCDC